jgi:hypothetical protein
MNQILVAYHQIRIDIINENIDLIPQVLRVMVCEQRLEMKAMGKEVYKLETLSR